MEVSHGWLALAASHAIGHDCSQESQESEAVASPGFGQQDDMDDSASSACLKAWWASQLTILGESVLQDLGHPATLRSELAPVRVMSSCSGILSEMFVLKEPACVFIFCV